MMSINSKPPSYEEVKKATFKKYERKVDAIISNIKDNSLKEKHKAILKRDLAKQLLKSIK